MRFNFSVLDFSASLSSLANSSFGLPQVLFSETKSLARINTRLLYGIFHKRCPKNRLLTQRANFIFSLLWVSIYNKYRVSQLLRLFGRQELPNRTHRLSANLQGWRLFRLDLNRRLGKPTWSSTGFSSVIEWIVELF